MPETSLQTGQILNNRYRIERLLGAGGMGEVYLAGDLSGGESVALKIIREGLDETDRRRFEREIRTLQTLRHPSIIEFHDLGLSGDCLFYTMDYAPGVTLEDVIADGGAIATSDQLDAVLRLLLQVVDALGYLHERRIVHRDVKPSNILLRAPGKETPASPRGWLDLADVSACLTDFGLVKTREDDGALTHTALGTPQYMAPEQIEATAVDERTDLYALGVILYRACTGTLPYARLSDALSRQPPPSARALNPLLPELLDDALARLLQFEAFRRPATAAEVHELLGAVLARRIAPEEHLPSIAKLSHPTFAGRHAELATLRDCVQQAARGHGRWVAVTGERGIGKSWLVTRSDFRTQALIQAGTAVYAGSFAPDRPHLGFQQLLSAVLRHLERHRGPAATREALGRWAGNLRTLLPQLSLEGWLDDSPPLEDVPQEVQKERIFDTVAAVLTAYAELEPRILVLEDIHYGDDFDLELLRRLVLQGTQLPLLVVTTHRPEFEGRLPALERLLNEMRSEDRLLEIPLEPFDRADTHTMVQSLLTPLREVSPQLVEVLLERTDGVPLYLLHLVNSLWNRELIQLEGNAWHVDPAEVRALPIPESTRSHYLLVLDEMEAQELKVLNVAAVIGPAFAFDVLLEVLDVDEFELDGICRRLVHAGVLQEHQDGFRFQHVFEQEILRARLSRPMLRRLHARVGKVLEHYHAGELDAHVGVIAEHKYLGGDLEQGVEYLRRAAGQAERAYAYRSALAYNRKALELCQDAQVRPALLVDSGDLHLKLGELEQALACFREATGYFTQVEELLVHVTPAPLTEAATHALGDYVQLLIKFGEVSVRRSDFGAALENFEKAERIARRLEEPEKIALSLVSQAAVFAYREEFPRAVDAYRAAIALHEHLAPGGGLAGAWGGLAAVEKVRGNLARAAECFQHALEISQTIGDQLLTARLLNNLGNLHRAQGKLPEAVESFERALEIRERLGDRHGVAVCSMNLGRVHAFLGDLRRSLEVLTRAQELFQTVGDTRGSLLTLGNLGTLHFYLGNFPTARAHLDEYLRDARRAGVLRAVGDAQLCLGVLELSLGGVDAAERCFDEGLAAFERAGDQEGMLLSRVQMARVRGRQGRLDEALVLCRDVAREAEARNAAEALAEALRVESEVLRARGELEAAAPLAQRALESLEEQHLTFHQATCCRTLGKIYRDLGFYYADKAGRYFERALRLFEMLGARHALAITRIEYGAFLGLVEEPEAARAQLEGAVRVFQELGTLDDLQRARQELEELLKEPL